MTTYLIIIGICVISYLLGSIPFGVIIGKMLKGIDIRTTGSGNIGT
ncbi:glycerol-3-phosphate acyltransferase, partial [bacterium]|nr:glycerol-3-phosphate acyltransferase [bacterium]